jgi:hypothetical protein
VASLIKMKTLDDMMLQQYVIMYKHLLMEQAMNVIVMFTEVSMISRKQERERTRR